MEKIIKIIEKDICTGCGACVSICPSSAIALQEKSTLVPVIDKTKCTNCMLCDSICPAVKENHFSVYKQNQHKGGSKFNPNLGNYENVYLAYSKDEDIRYNSASGGAVTSFLVFLLEKNYIDAAMLTFFSQSDPTKPMIKIVSTKKDIIGAKGSKYCPVPFCMGIKQIIKSKHKRIALVGLGCHLSAINNYARINKDLADKIFIKLGLFCGQYINFDGLDYFFRQNKVDKKDIKLLQFRGDGWPGKVKLVTSCKNIQRDFLEFFEPYTWGFFEPNCCLRCKDFSNESADISFSDAWSDDFRMNSPGANYVITRSATADDIWTRNKMNNIKVINPNRVLDGMEWRFFTKKDMRCDVINNIKYSCIRFIFHINSKLSSILAPSDLSIYLIYFRKLFKSLRKIHSYIVRIIKKKGKFYEKDSIIGR